MTEFLTAREAFARFGIPKSELKGLHVTKTGLFGLEKRYWKRDLLRRHLIGYAFNGRHVPAQHFVYLVVEQAMEQREEGILFEPLPTGELEVRFFSGKLPPIVPAGMTFPVAPEYRIPVTAMLKDTARLAMDVTDRIQLGGVRGTYKGLEDWDMRYTVEPTHFGERVRLELRPVE